MCKKKQLSLQIGSESELATLASFLAENLQRGQFIALCGDLGAGKTTFTRYLSRALGCATLATSPTFSLIQEYSGVQVQILHADLYRLETKEELENLGWWDLLQEHHLSVKVVEWADKFSEQGLPEDRLTLFFTYLDSEDARGLDVLSQGSQSDLLWAKIEKRWRR